MFPNKFLQANVQKFDETFYNVKASFLTFNHKIYNINPE